MRAGDPAASRLESRPNSRPNSPSAAAQVERAVTANAEPVAKLAAQAVVKPALRAEVLERARRLRVWRISDFPGLPPLAVAQALSRLVRRGVLARVSKGEYIVPVNGVDGTALHRLRAYAERPESSGDLGRSGDGAPARSSEPPVFPSGVLAAHELKLTFQNTLRPVMSTPALRAPKRYTESGVRVVTRRPPAWHELERREGALLEVLRERGIHSQFAPEPTAKVLARCLLEKGRLARVLAVAPSEPPRVRAMLGALIESSPRAKTAVRPAELEALRSSLNPLSRFDFGRLGSLPTAMRWFARLPARSG
jgi:hypothetical protein